jgi:DNA modification methylase
MEYKDFLEKKFNIDIESGFKTNIKINDKLYDFQKDIVKWSLRKGRSAIFADCGLGKTPIQLEWSFHVNKKTKKPILIFAPLAVSKQTVREGKKFNIKVGIAEIESDIKSGIYITNYEKLHKFDFSKISGIVLDESSILKSYSGKFRNEIIEKTKHIPYKLCCTATPAPNDYMELGNHAEFLGIMKRVEMLSMFFIHDSGQTQKWRLKGHAEFEFWKWLSHWSIVLRKPSDLGYKDGRFNLPKIHFKEHIIKSQRKPTDTLFILEARTLQDRQKARRETINDRVDYLSKLINGDDGQWLIWCNLNSESSELKNKIKDSVEVKGSDSEKHKEHSMLGFSNKEVNKLVTKPLIAGFGMNWQNCNKMAFIGLSDSYEQYYQAVRRCWRFGQKKEVYIHIIITEEEGQVLKNIRRKEKDAEKMYDNMVEHIRNLSIAEVRGLKKQKSAYKTDKIQTKNWTMILGDSVEEIKKIESNSIGYSIFSPPFAELYTYSNSDRDMGNSKNYDDFFIHFKFLAKELYRVVQPGRNLSFHCVDIPAMKERDGYIGLKDFPADLIDMFENCNNQYDKNGELIKQEGFIYHSKHIIWKDPLIEATRTKSLGLMHKQIQKDSSRCRAGLPDYLITMRKPGECEIPIEHQDGITCYYGNDEPKISGIKYSHLVWQKYASPVWMDIRQSNTLNKVNARDGKDEKHICPLQLDVIARCLELWSYKGDVIYSPFAGIGSEGYQAILMNRKFLGCELKESYYKCAIDNLKMANEKKNEGLLIKEVC